MKTLLFLKINSKIRRGPPALASIQQEDHYVGNIGEVPISHSQEGGVGGGGCNKASNYIKRMRRLGVIFCRMGKVYD